MDARGPRRWILGLSAGALAAGMTCASGCADPLLPSDGRRSQFDNYDQSRGAFEPQFVEDEFGRREPNIRGRLMPQ